jgi:hypothetical protein
MKLFGIVAIALFSFVQSCTDVPPLPTNDPQAACDDALQGSRILDAIWWFQVPLICETRPADGIAPASAGGEYGNGQIHLWPVGLKPALIRKLAAHELGHFFWDYRPDIQATWASIRGLSGQNLKEDFAESFYRAEFGEPTIQSYVCYGGSCATNDELVLIMWWFNGN